MAGAIRQAVASLVQSAKGQAEAVEQATSIIIGGGLADGWRVDVRGNHNLQQSHAPQADVGVAISSKLLSKVFKSHSAVVTHHCCYSCSISSLYIARLAHW